MIFSGNYIGRKQLSWEAGEEYTIEIVLRFKYFTRSTISDWWLGANEKIKRITLFKCYFPKRKITIYVGKIHLGKN